MGSLDPFRGYANAIRDELPDAVVVLDAFRVVKSGSTALDEVRRRVQQETLHRRGHKDDPLYRIRRTLMTGVEHLTEKQKIRLEKHLPTGDPNGGVHLAWQAYQRLRAIYHATNPETGRRLAEQLIDVLHNCPIPELARLGRTLRQWRQQTLACFTTGGVNNGGTEAINGVLEDTTRNSTTGGQARRAASPAASATSTTTDYGSCSPPTEPGPTEDDLPMLDAEEPREACVGICWLACVC